MRLDLQPGDTQLAQERQGLLSNAVSHPGVAALMHRGGHGLASPTLARYRQMAPSQSPQVVHSFLDVVLPAETIPLSCIWSLARAQATLLLLLALQDG